jgi:hypothetical protein
MDALATMVPLPTQQESAEEFREAAHRLVDRMADYLATVDQRSVSTPRQPHTSLPAASPLRSHGTVSRRSRCGTIPGGMWWAAGHSPID